MTGQDGRYRRKPFKRTIRNAHCRPLVTVCIAAVKYSPEPTIVAVSDMMLTGADNYKYESAVIKAFQLDGFDRWHVLFANLPCAFVAVWRETVKQLSPMEAPPRVADVRSAIQGAYSAEIGTIIERQILGPLDMTREEFKAKGVKLLGKDEFSKQVEQIQAVELPLQLIVYGFDNGAQPYLFEVDGTGTFYDHTFPGYVGIGQGSGLAVQALSHDPTFRTPQVPLNTMIYRMCEAKFTAESDNSVGGATVVSVHTPGANYVIYPDAIYELHTIWRNGRRAAPPPKVDEIIARSLAPFATLLKDETDPR